MMEIQPYDVSPQTATAMYNLIKELFPLCRSITGNGVVQTLKRIQQEIPLEIHQVPTGTPVFDWTVPKEWNIRDAYIKNSKGERIVDFNKCNLHVVSYSVPVFCRLSLKELLPHLHSIPEKPDWIPYRTSYYEESWGFCVTHNFLQSLEEEEYEVLIDSELKDGFLTYGECFLPGESQREFLLSCNVCHPSLANDNLSGIALLTFFAKHFLETRHTFSIRLLFLPATIGAITWLALHENAVDRIAYGLIAANVGDRGHMRYKKSRKGNTRIDRAAAHVLRHTQPILDVRDFSPYGYDERQFCSPGFNLAVGSLTRTPYGEYAEYHTSADNLDFVHPDCLLDSLQTYLKVFEILEKDRRYENTCPKCEPQLGKRGLYRSLGGRMDCQSREFAMLWILNFSDGQHSLLDIAERSGFEFRTIYEVARVLEENRLLKTVVF